jgi:hypothetical protein
MDPSEIKKKLTDANVKFACFSYLADRFHGEIVMGLQLNGDSVVGVRYLEFGGNF